MAFNTESDTRRLPGSFVLNPSSDFQYYSVSRNGTELRIYPQIGVDGNPLPMRSGREMGDVGDWVNADHYAVEYLGGDAGKPRIATLLTIKGDEKKVKDERRGIIVWETMTRLLYHLTERGMAPQHWYAWVQARQDAVFGPRNKSRPKIMAVVRGLLTGKMTTSGPANYVSRQKPRLKCVFGFKANAQKALRDLVMKETPDAVNNHSTDWAKIFVHENDIIDIQTGRMLQFTAPNQAYGNRVPTTGTVAFDTQAGGLASGGDDDDKFAVAVKLADVVSVPLSIVQAAWEQPWSELLNIYPDEKSLVTTLATCLPDDLLIQAFDAVPAWLPERLLQVRANLRNASGAGFTPDGKPIVLPPTGAVPIQFPNRPSNVELDGMLQSPPQGAFQPTVQQGASLVNFAAPQPPVQPTVPLDAVFGVNQQAQSGVVSAPNPNPNPNPSSGADTGGQPIGDGPAGLDALSNALRGLTN